MSWTSSGGGGSIADMTSRHREAVLVWTAVVPTLTVLQLGLGPLLAHVPAPLRPPLMATLAVPIVVYLVIPLLLKRFPGE